MIAEFQLRVGIICFPVIANSLQFAQWCPICYMVATSSYPTDTIHTYVAPIADLVCESVARNPSGAKTDDAAACPTAVDRF